MAIKDALGAYNDDVFHKISSGRIKGGGGGGGGGTGTGKDTNFYSP